MSGNILLTSSSPNFEISADNANFSSSFSVPYNGGQLSSSHVYIRISASANIPGTVLSGNIIHSGTNAPDLALPVNGYVTKEYYNTRMDAGLQNTATWSSTVDGTGSAPVSFTEGHQVFNIVNQAFAHYTGVWDLSAIDSRIKIGDGINPINFTIPAGTDLVTSGSIVDISSNATLTLMNNVIPSLRTMADNSTVDFAQAGTGVNDRIIIPINSYYNLKLTNGLKYIYDGVTTIRGDLTTEGAYVDGKSAFPYVGTYPGPPTFNCFGNVNFLNGTTFNTGTTYNDDDYRIWLS